MKPEDFFKTLGDVKTEREMAALLSYVGRIVRKYFSDLIDAAILRQCLEDRGIPDDDRLWALRDRAEGVLRFAWFDNSGKYDGGSFLSKGLTHPMVRTLLKSVRKGCPVVVSPRIGGGHWVVHALGMSPDALKKPRVLIPSDGAVITIQRIENFVEEHK